MGEGSAVATNTTCQQVPDARPGVVSCSPTSLRIRASSLSVINASATYNPEGEDPDYYPRGRRPPPRPTNFVSSPPAIKPSSPTCKELSRSPSWKVGPVSYSFQGVRFLLTNQALNYTVQCDLRDFTDQILTVEPKWRNCTRYNNNRATYPYDGIYTEVYYGGASDVLGVKQKWHCEGGPSPANASLATAYTAQGQVFTSFNCTQTRSCAPSDDPDIAPYTEFRTYCDMPELTMTPNATKTEVMPQPEAKAYFTPHGYNCTDRSLGTKPFKSPKWEINNFTFNRTWSREMDPPAFQDTAGFTYSNTAINSEWPMLGLKECYDQGTPWYPLFNGSKDLHCQGGPADYPLFRFDYNTSTLTMSQIWGCDATDISHRYVQRPSQRHLISHRYIP